MNFLLILIIAIILVSVITGFRKGLFGILFGLFAWGFIFAAVIVGSPRMYAWIENNTDLRDRIYVSAQEYVENKLNYNAAGGIDEITGKAGEDSENNSTGDASQDAGAGDGSAAAGAAGDDAEDSDKASTPLIADLINTLVSDVKESKSAAASDFSQSTGNGTSDSAFPPSLTRSIRGAAQEAVDAFNAKGGDAPSAGGGSDVASADGAAAAASDAAEAAQGNVISAVAAAVAKKVTDYAMACLSRVFTIALAAIIVIVVALIIRIIELDRGIRTNSHFLGGVFGLVAGFMISWIILFAISCVGTTSGGQVLAGNINNSAFLTWMYNNNPIGNILIALIKGNL